MSPTVPDIAHLLIALGLLLVAAHAVGHLFALLRQPRVIGELVGGLLLGPTLLGTLAPGTEAWLFPATGTVPTVVGWFSQMGLLLLMFCSGVEMRSIFARDERRLVAWVTVTGLAIPFAAGLAAFRLADANALIGSAHSRPALLLVFALAIAVTSIPVISRIMFDLGIIDTRFARIVLGVAVLEDVVVYVVLAIALGLAAASDGDSFGLPALLGLSEASPASMALHTVVTLAFFVAMLTIGTSTYAWSRRQGWNLLVRGNPIGYHLVFLFAGTLACVLLGITPMFGAFLAGIAASATRDPADVAARESIKSFSFAFFVPIYFAVVGLQLDLLRDLDLGFFAWFLLLACVVKSGSVFLGARLGGEPRTGAWSLAIATNARGGPGIVLASVTFAAGIISSSLFAALVMLAVVTSMLAGTWLARMVRLGTLPREQRRVFPLDRIV
ncbi:MAG TPA: cation:proton antiporter [Marmoricola sp.]|nr:cation:proton antiporter [Marmoricola sp.]